MLLLKQGEQAWLLAGASGNHEFARLQWFDDEKGQGPRYRVGPGGNARLGPADLLHCAIDDHGATMEWSGDRMSFIPRDWFQVTIRR